MDIGRKIVWAEGVFLGQQHFQQWEQSFDDKYQLLIKYQLDNRYGICELIIDESELEYGNFKIEQCLCLMKDGRWVQFISGIDNDVLSLPLNEPQQEIYLAMAKGESVSGVSGYPDNNQHQVAWQADYQKCSDIYDPKREQEVLFAKQKLFLSTTANSPETICYLKLAEVKIDINKRYHLSSYIPSVLNIRASKPLIKLLVKILNELSLRIKQIKGTYKDEPNKAIKENSSLSYSLLLLAILSKYYAELSCYQQGIDDSPQKLFKTLFTLHTELSAFCLTETAYNISFNPNNLQQTFAELQDGIFDVLDKAHPLENDLLVLEKVEENLYHCNAINRESMTGKYLYLEVNNLSGNNNDGVVEFERSIKIGSANQIYNIYSSAVTGVQLVYSKRPPSSITLKPNCEYFQIVCKGRFWQQILEEQVLAILLFKEHTYVSLDLIAIEG